jgi:hypothetical protein
VDARVRASGDLTPELERRLDRRLARAAFAAGADAVLRVDRRGPSGTGTARAFVARGLGVRWTEPPPSPARPGTAEAAVSSRGGGSAFVVPTLYDSAAARIVREAPRLETLVRDSSVGRAAAQRLATIAQASPARHRAARAVTGALEARARQLAVSPEARERLERWAHEAHEELQSRPPAAAPQETVRFPAGCALVVLGLFAVVVFNLFGTCIRMMTTPQ